MAKYSEAQLDDVFGALADSTRRGILERLAKGDSSVTELWDSRRMALPSFMKHVRILESARLIETEKDGRVRRCVLKPDTLKSAQDWVEFHRRFWRERLDALGEYFAENDPEKKT